MKSLLTDVVGGAGLACLAAGIYLKYGLAESLLAAGAVLPAIAIVAAASRRAR